VKGGWLYIMTNRPNGPLDVGATANLARRTWAQRTGMVDGFTKRYGLIRLVSAERHADISAAIHREKRVKHWPRAWKVRLTHSINPDWGDLYDQLP